MNGNTHGVRELFQFESIYFSELESWNTLKYFWTSGGNKKREVWFFYLKHKWCEVGIVILLQHHLNLFQSVNIPVNFKGPFNLV